MRAKRVSVRLPSMTIVPLKGAIGEPKRPSLKGRKIASPAASREFASASAAINPVASSIAIYRSVGRFALR